MSFNELNRREILKSLMGMTAALMAPGLAFGQATQPSGAPVMQPIARDKWGDLLPQRKLGRKGPYVTMLGMGGAHVGTMPDDVTAQKAIETAIAGGIRYFDTAASYRNSEARYGSFLTPKYRDNIFITSKSIASNGTQARAQLDQSLSRLKSDYLDLWHIHSIQSADDVNTRIANGVLDVMLEVKEKGKVRNIGFSGHVIPDSHLHLLERGKEKDNPFTAAQMPINVADPSYRSFILNFVPKGIEAGLGIIAMKTLANGGFFGGADGKAGTNPKVVPDRVSIADALHFVWSLPISVLVSGADNADMIQEKIDLARNFNGMTEQRRGELIAKAADLAGLVAEPHKSDERAARGARGNRNGRGRGAAVTTQPSNI